GYYADDAVAYRWIKEQAPDRKLCLEAQVMDWSDDVAYSVHDLEDGLQAGHITLRALRGAAERAAVTELATGYSPAGTAQAELEGVFDRLLGLPFWPRSFDGGHAERAALAARHDPRGGGQRQLRRCPHELTLDGDERRFVLTIADLRGGVSSG